MARRKTPSERVSVDAAISARLRSIREELCGEDGGPEMARRLNLPARTWYNYETGVTVPAEVLLRFIEETGASPGWLLDGTGEPFGPAGRPGLTAVELIRRGLEMLEGGRGEGSDRPAGGPKAGGGPGQGTGRRPEV